MTYKYQGLVIKAISGFYTVRTAELGDVVCQLWGRLKQSRQTTDIVAVGDEVTISQTAAQEGMIESVAPRRNSLARARPQASGGRQSSADREQVLVANLDQVVLVFSFKKPRSHLRKLDRFLIVTERTQLPTIICVNKVDLAAATEAEAQFGLYADIGYPVLYTSAKTGQGVEKLAHMMQGKISALSGSSGVGKSSLLNRIQPGLGLQVRQVSQATGKGLHTTRHTELFSLDGGGYVADTPGIRGLALYDLEAEEIDAYFREIAPLVAQCRFSDCTHQHEPKCAVQAAVKSGKIAGKRYQSYLRLRQEHEDLDRAMYD